MQKLITTDGAAEILSVTRRTVYRLIKSGQLQSVKVNSAVRIPENSLEEFLKRNIVNNSNTSNVDVEKGSTLNSLMKHFGTWKGSKEEVEEIIEYIKENRTEAEF
ncbi:MAG: Helix-turn-helix domain [Candidatus Poribacteria bacterium]|nr:Helix-turn-helix domain [Candidatus Poribacteria bacterium]MDQ1328913.1 Helix-turn-helix domain [Candidatus Poribacteria bacterium]